MYNSLAQQSLLPPAELVECLLQQVEKLFGQGQQGNNKFRWYASSCWQAVIQVVCYVFDKDMAAVDSLLLNSLALAKRFGTSALQPSDSEDLCKLIQFRLSRLNDSGDDKLSGALYSLKTLFGKEKLLASQENIPSTTSRPQRLNFAETLELACAHTAGQRIARYGQDEAMAAEHAQGLSELGRDLAWDCIVALLVSPAGRSAPETQKNLQTLVELNANILGESRFITAWQSYCDNLASHRAALKHAVGQTGGRLAFTEALRQYNECLRGLLAQMAADNVALLGAPPCQYAILAVGSLAREEALPYSDFEYLLIVERKDKRAAHEIALIDTYFLQWAKLLHFKIACLGETWSAENPDNPLGFHVDDGISPVIKAGSTKLDGGYGTAEEIFERYVRDGVASGQAYSVLKPLYVCGSSEGERLFQGYLSELERILASRTIALEKNQPKLSLRERLCVAQQHGHWEELKRYNEKWAKETGVVSLKALSTMLMCLAHDLALERQIKLTDARATVDVLGLLAQAGALPPETAKMLQDAYQLVLYWRLQAQHYYGQCLKGALDDGDIVALPNCTVAERDFQYGQCQSYLRFSKVKTLWALPETGLNGACLQAVQFGVFVPLAQAQKPEEIADVLKTLAAPKWMEITEKAAVRAQLHLRFLGLAWRGAPLADWRGLFLQGMAQLASIEQANAWRDSFTAVLAEDAALPGLSQEQAEVIKRDLDACPNHDGSRPSLVEAERAWAAQLDALWVEETDSVFRQPLYCGLPPLKATYAVFIEGKGWAKRQACLHPAIAKALRDSGCLTVSGQQYQFVAQKGKAALRRGRHQVAAVEAVLGGQAVAFHAKFYPEAPGIELQAGCLIRRLIGWGAPFVTLVRLHVLSDANQPTQVPVLLSQTVGGYCLSDYFDPQCPAFQAQADLKQLSSKAFTQRVLVGLATQQEDLKADNMVVAAIDRCLWSIENDRSFCPSVVRTAEGIVPVVKDITFCFDDMQKGLDPQASVEWLALDMAAVASAWLAELGQSQAQMQCLFSDDETRRFFAGQASGQRFGNMLQRLGLRVAEAVPQQSALLVPLRHGLAAELYLRLCELQRAVRERPNDTHAMLAAEIEPCLWRKFYAPLLEHTGHACLRFYFGFARYYGKAGGNVSELRTLGTPLASLETLHGKPLNIEQLFESRDDQVQRAQAQLQLAKVYINSYQQLHALRQRLYQCDPSVLKEIEQLPTLLCEQLLEKLRWGLMKTGGQTNLSFQREFLKVLLARPMGFQRLALREAVALDDASLKALVQNSPSLRYLRLQACPNVSPAVLALLTAEDIALEELHLQQQLWRYFAKLEPRGKGLIAIKFSALKAIVIKGCGRIEDMLFIAPALQRLALLNTEVKNRFQVNAPIKLLDLHGSPNLTDDGLKFLVQGLALLPAQLRLDNCPQVNFPQKKANEPSLASRPADKLADTRYLVIAASKEQYVETLAWLLRQQVPSQDRLNELLFVAVENLNIKGAALLLKQGASVNSRDKSGNTVLHCVINKYGKEQKKLKLVKELLLQGGEINAADGQGQTAFMLALRKGHRAIVEHLVEQRAERPQELLDERLLRAAKDLNLSHMQWLLSQGADIKARNQSDDTVLHCAIGARRGDEQKKLALVKELLSQWAEINAVDSKKQTAFVLALRKGHRAIVERLVEQRAERPQALLNEYLLKAANDLNLNDVQWLLSQGADIKAQDHSGDTVLHCAIGTWPGNEQKKLALVKELLSRGAEINAANNEGQTAFMLALRNDHYAIVEYLAKQRAERPQALLNEYLLKAANDLNLNDVQWLLSQGADVNARNQSGDTVLHCAIGARRGDEQKKLEVVKELLSRGAEINAENNERQTALVVLALFNGCPSVGEYLAQQNSVELTQAFLDENLLQCAGFLVLNSAQWLLSQGADIKARDGSGNTALHWAINANSYYGSEQEKLRFVKELLSRYESEQKKLRLVKELLSRGAEINAANNEGQTAFMLALRKGHRAIVEHLVEQTHNTHRRIYRSQGSRIKI